MVRKGETITLTIDMDAAAVAGRVIYGRGGPPVEGSIVEALPEHSNQVADRTISERDGSFTLNLPPGRYHIMARQPHTWAAGVAQDVEVPTSRPVEIIQRDLFAHGDTGNPQTLSIEVSGLEPGDVLTGPVEIRLEVYPEDVLLRYIGVRIGHQDPQLAYIEIDDDAEILKNRGFSFTLDPPDYGPGSTYLHVVAYDVELNAVQLIIPFTVPPHPAGGPPLPAPARVEVAGYTFLTSFQFYSLEQMDALSEELAPYGVNPAELTPEVIPPYNRWVRVLWDPVPGAVGYRIYRRAEGSHESALVADWSDSRRPTMYMDASADLSPGVRYHYSIRAYDGNGQMGLASHEVPIVLLEPFEVRLVEPDHHQHVARPVILRWERNHLQPLPGATYDYVYRVGVSGELHPGGLVNPELSTLVRNQEDITIPPERLIPGRSYQWDLLVAYATVQLSETFRAFTVSGRYVPSANPETIEPTGSSLNGAFRFTVEPELFP